MDVLNPAHNVADRSNDGIKRMVIKKLIKKMTGEALGDVKSMVSGAFDGVKSITGGAIGGFMCLLGKCKKNPLTKPGPVIPGRQTETPSRGPTRRPTKRPSLRPPFIKPSNGSSWQFYKLGMTHEPLIS